MPRTGAVLGEQLFCVNLKNTNTYDDKDQSSAGFERVVILF